MQGLPKLLLHSKALAQLPPTGQRRDMLLKQLRQIQVTPERGGDFQWSVFLAPSPTQVTVVVGYAISWIIQDGHISILDIRGQ
ncbi:hypothetical protein [Rubritalea profundi]|uniref:Uncharacterized protein n=1 Tax=Rubritalea profundi TaxID=1658618 RepID=A0A2S7U2F1_9BACT|nr:hypothetical protein [Rubritalea profundi]PQJ29165.1 hypothetical protein BSZ32_12140 [Rubritalea profundi]